MEHTATAATAAYVLIVALVAGTLGQVLSGIFRLPSILFLLALGVLIGPDGLKVIDPKADLHGGLEIIVRLSVAFILFEGGMALRLPEIRKVQKSVRRLITVGVLLTFVSAAAAAHFIMGVPIKYAALFGALVTVTGPTVIRPLVQRIKIRPEIAAILEGEGILADPIGAILAAVCLEYALSAEPGALLHLQEFGIRIGLGLGVGAVTGFLAGLIVKYHAPSVERMKPLVVMACALGCYGIAEMIRHESGIMAVVAAGVTIQYGIPAYDRSLREFKELITTVLLSVLFILLAANLRLSQMTGVGMPGLITVLVVMLAIRPLNIFVCTAGATPKFREKLFLSWVAPRGIVAASVASLAALVLTGEETMLLREQLPVPESVREQAAGGRAVEALVFLTVFLTVFLQGGSAKLLSWILGIAVKDARSVLILGANPIARAVARAYRDEGKKVTLVDRNPVLVEETLQEGLRALCGDGTDREVLHLAGVDTADIFIALTGRSTVNQTAAQRVLHERDMEHVWIALEESERTRIDPALVRSGARLAFGRAVAFDTWSHRLGSGEARLVEIEVKEKNTPKKALGDLKFSPDVLPVMWRRAERVQIALSATRLQAGDRLIVLTRAANEDFLKLSLGIVPEAEGKAAKGEGGGS